MEPRAVDVVVVGAGAAGLAAAARLKRKRRSIVVIEARDRVGGRVETLRDAAFPAPIELGAEFVHGTPKSLLTVLEQNRIRIRRHEDAHWLLHAGALRRADRAFEQVSELLIESGHADRTFAAHLKDPRTVAKWPDLERDLAAMFVEGYYAAPLNVAGTAAIAQMERRTSEVNAQELFRVTDGYDRVTAALGEVLEEPEELWLNAVVHEVRWGPNGVEVFSRTRRDVELPSVKARRAILSVPLAVLAAKPREVGAIRFAPGLPEKVHAVQRLAMGSIIKIALRFRRAFWDDPEVRSRAAGKLGRFSFAHGRGLAFPTFWMPRPFQHPVLVGWTAGHAADALAGVGEDLLTLNALESLSALFGHRVPELEALLVAVRTRDWQADPFARGGYAVLPVNGLEAQQELARPIGDRLFFAGEATHTGGFAGTVHGAIETGIRAANEVLEADRR